MLWMCCDWTGSISLEKKYDSWLNISIPGPKNNVKSRFSLLSIEKVSAYGCLLYVNV